MHLFSVGKMERIRVCDTRTMRFICLLLLNVEWHHHVISPVTVGPSEHNDSSLHLQSVESALHTEVYRRNLTSASSAPVISSSVSDEIKFLSEEQKIIYTGTEQHVTTMMEFVNGSNTFTSYPSTRETYSSFFISDQSPEENMNSSSHKNLSFRQVTDHVTSATEALSSSDVTINSTLHRSPSDVSLVNSTNSVQLNFGSVIDGSTQSSPCTSTEHLADTDTSSYSMLHVSKVTEMSLATAASLEPSVSNVDRLVSGMTRNVSNVSDIVTFTNATSVSFTYSSTAGSNVDSVSYISKVLLNNSNSISYSSPTAAMSTKILFAPTSDVTEITTSFEMSATPSSQVSLGDISVTTTPYLVTENSSLSLLANTPYLPINGTEAYPSGSDKETSSSVSAQLASSSAVVKSSRSSFRTKEHTTTVTSTPCPSSYITVITDTTLCPSTETTVSPINIASYNDSITTSYPLTEETIMPYVTSTTTPCSSTHSTKTYSDDSYDSITPSLSTEVELSSVVDNDTTASPSTETVTTSCVTSLGTPYPSTRDTETFSDTSYFGTTSCPSIKMELSSVPLSNGTTTSNTFTTETTTACATSISTPCSSIQSMETSSDDLHGIVTPGSLTILELGSVTVTETVSTASPLTDAVITSGVTSANTPSPSIRSVKSFSEASYLSSTPCSSAKVELSSVVLTESVTTACPSTTSCTTPCVTSSCTPRPWTDVEESSSSGNYPSTTPFPSAKVEPSSVRFSDVTTSEALTTETISPCATSPCSSIQSIDTYSDGLYSSVTPCMSTQVEISFVSLTDSLTTACPSTETSTTPCVTSYSTPSPWTGVQETFSTGHYPSTSPCSSTQLELGSVPFRDSVATSGILTEERVITEETITPCATSLSSPRSSIQSMKTSSHGLYGSTTPCPSTEVDITPCFTSYSTQCPSTKVLESFSYDTTPCRSTVLEVSSVDLNDISTTACLSTTASATPCLSSASTPCTSTQRTENYADGSVQSTTPCPSTQVELVSVTVTDIGTIACPSTAVDTTPCITSSSTPCQSTEDMETFVDGSYPSTTPCPSTQVELGSVTTTHSFTTACPSTEMYTTPCITSSSTPCQSTEDMETFVDGSYPSTTPCPSTQVELGSLTTTHSFTTACPSTEMYTTPCTTSSSTPCQSTEDMETFADGSYPSTTPCPSTQVELGSVTTTHSFTTACPSTKTYTTPCITSLSTLCPSPESTTPSLSTQVELSSVDVGDSVTTECPSTDAVTTPCITSWSSLSPSTEGVETFFDGSRYSTTPCSPTVVDATPCVVTSSSTPHPSAEGMESFSDSRTPCRTTLMQVSSFDLSDISTTACLSTIATATPCPSSASTPCISSEGMENYSDGSFQYTTHCASTQVELGSVPCSDNVTTSDILTEETTTACAISLSTTRSSIQSTETSSDCFYGSTTPCPSTEVDSTPCITSYSTPCPSTEVMESFSYGTTPCRSTVMEVSSINLSDSSTTAFPSTTASATPCLSSASTPCTSTQGVENYADVSFPSTTPCPSTQMELVSVTVTDSGTTVCPSTEVDTTPCITSLSTPCPSSEGVETVSDGSYPRTTPCLSTQVELSSVDLGENVTTECPSTEAVTSPCCATSNTPYPSTEGVDTMFHGSYPSTAPPLSTKVEHSFGDLTESLTSECLSAEVDTTTSITSSTPCQSTQVTETFSDGSYQSRTYPLTLEEHSSVSLTSSVTVLDPVTHVPTDHTESSFTSHVETALGSSTEDSTFVGHVSDMETTTTGVPSTVSGYVSQVLTEVHGSVFSSVADTDDEMLSRMPMSSSTAAVTTANNYALLTSFVRVSDGASVDSSEALYTEQDGVTVSVSPFVRAILDTTSHYSIETEPPVVSERSSVNTELGVSTNPTTVTVATSELVYASTDGNIVSTGVTPSVDVTFSSGTQKIVPVTSRHDEIYVLNATTSALVDAVPGYYCLFNKLSNF